MLWATPANFISHFTMSFSCAEHLGHFWALKTAMNTTSYSGNMWFTGLPFNVPAPYSSLGGIYLSHIGTYSGYGPFLFLSGTVAYALLHQSNASSWSAVMHNVVSSGGEVYIAGSYKV